MNSQSLLWLIPLVAFQILSAVFYLKAGLRWGWGGLLQSLIILGIGLLGLGDLRHFPPLSLPVYAPICALVGWGLMLLRGLLPLFLLKKLARHIMLLDTNAAQADARALRLFFWGLPGKFWCDLAQAMELYAAGQENQADELLNNWSRQMLPLQNRESLNICRMSGRMTLHDWDGIINQYQQHQLSSQFRVPFSIASAASRAYAEKGEITQALQCLKEAELPAARLSDETRDLAFLSFYSLSGAQEELDNILKRLSSGKEKLPLYTTLYWRGRCLTVQHQVEQARLLLQEALSLVPASTPAWRSRIEYQLSHLNEVTANGTRDWSSEIAQAQKIQERSCLVSEIVSPRRRCLAVIVLIVIMCITFAISSSALFLPTSFTVPATLFCWQWGVLDPQLMLTGQYWRLLTYLFMHAHISHLALNVIGLWWFGKMSENLYGTSRFVAIYFVSGILSGITHSLLSPHMIAVGASGAIMGVFGATLAGIYRCKNILPDSLRKTEVSFMVGIVLAQLILDHIIPHVAAFAHLGGLLSGFLLGLMLPLEGLRRYPGSQKPNNLYS